MKLILQSIKPRYCELIAAGKKTIEGRKTRPKLDVPFKVYIYCSKDKLALLRDNNDTEEKYKYDHWEWAEFHQSCGMEVLGGTVIGEYVCDEIIELEYDVLEECYLFKDCYSGYIFDEILSDTGLSESELQQYGKGEPLYLWHISDLKIYDKPKELSEFFGACKQPKGTDCSVCRDNREHTCKSLTHPPQSWCYVEESNG